GLLGFGDEPGLEVVAEGVVSVGGVEAGALVAPDVVADAEGDVCECVLPVGPGPGFVAGDLVPPPGDVFPVGVGVVVPGEGLDAGVAAAHAAPSVGVHVGWVPVPSS